MKKNIAIIIVLLVGCTNNVLDEDENIMVDVSEFDHCDTTHAGLRIIGPTKPDLFRVNYDERTAPEERVCDCDNINIVKVVGCTQPGEVVFAYDAVNPCDDCIDLYLTAYYVVEYVDCGVCYDGDI